MTIRLYSCLVRFVLPLCVIGLIHPAAAQAQPRPSPQDAPSQSWPAPSIGIHAGYDQVVRGEMLGGQIRIPVVRSGQIELLGIGSAIFVSGLREYQYDVDAVYSTGGRRGGLYLGGGLSFRNTIFGTDRSSPRETRQGYGVVVGLQSGGLIGALLTQFEFRWVFLPENLDPKMISLGLNFPLWGRGGQAGRFGS